MNTYRILADLVALLHLAYVGVVLIGMLLILVGVARGWRWVRNFWFRVIHLAMIALVVAQSLGGIICPLTTWEYQLRLRAGQSASSGSFIERLVQTLIFFDVPGWVFTVCYAVFGTAVLLTFILAPPRWPWRKATAKSR
jgi:hypothetical protein